MSQSEIMPPTPWGRPGRLDRIGDVRHEMARVYRLACRGGISMKDAGTAIFILDRIGRAIEGTELERRVEVLEEDLEENDDD